MKGIRKENGGYGSVLQLAIAQLDTPYFLICDPDDTLEPKAVETLLKLAKVSQADITIGAKMIMVAVVSDAFLTQTFGCTTAEAVGKTFDVTVNGFTREFYIVGVFAYENSSTNSDTSDVTTTVYIPVKTAKKINGSNDGYSSITVEGATSETSDSTAFLEKVQSFFASYYTQNDSYTIEASNMYASEEKVTIKGPKGEMSARVLGPLRSRSQVEISLTEARQLGVEAMVRESGDIDGTKGVTLVGPAGEITIPAGVIAAKRHIHMTPADAEAYGVKNGDIVAVKIETAGRSLVFGDTVIRVKDSFKLAMQEVKVPFEQREGTILLEAGKTWNCSYRIQVL